METRKITVTSGAKIDGLKQSDGKELMNFERGD